ncbi:hypothetical protein MSP8886_01348 [Marinomonas spartinae]|uniref:Uncharacterized protein n=1 Tax=Marinomonas spartinae TaxID=1792290 RepID=A0A1A8TAV8_9GAMM|nr:hypothetical protein [Marinomonas spartinae]SBS28886.1 hypothetical protein MSP8886_01348 [Marinomonas spartinae]
MTINQVERAFRAWSILVEVARNRQAIKYKELGDETAQRAKIREGS